MGGRGGSSGFTGSKGSYNLTGSEKQISYAKEIIKNVENSMDSYIKQNAGRPGVDQVKEMEKKILNNMKNSYAGDIIEDFKNVPKSGSAEERVRKIIERIEVARKVMGRNYRK